MSRESLYWQEIIIFYPERSGGTGFGNMHVESGRERELDEALERS